MTNKQTMTNETLKGKPDAGNPHVAPTPSYGGTGRFDEGEAAPENPRRGFRLYHKMALIPFAVAALTEVFAVSAVADENEWVYDTSKRKEVLPASASVTYAGLDAKARGVDAALPAAVDKWFWTWSFSEELPVDFSAPGLLLFLR